MTPNAQTAEPAPVLAEALKLHAAGFAPVLQRGKQAFQRDWNKKRQTPEQLRGDFRPGMNVAVITGELSQTGGKCLVVVDVDLRSRDEAHKRDAWAKVQELAPGAKITTRTGGGGAHAWFWIPLDRLPKIDKLLLAKGPEIQSPENKTKPAWAIEALLNGHACTVPPSIHPSGKPYQWANGDAHVEDAPAALIDAIERAAREIGRPLSIAVPEWPAPESLLTLPDVPKFNYDYLPGLLRGFVHDIAERMQCPPEFPAVGAVVMAGAAIGRKLGIRPKQFDSWTVVPNLWGMIVGQPGIMKSPALADALAPLNRMQALAFDAHTEALREYEIERKGAKLRAEVNEIEARKKLKESKGSADITEQLRAQSDPEAPKAKRYITVDSSWQALAETLEENPDGVLCERDELSGLLRSMDNEGQQEARAFYLTAADGDKPFITDRIGRGRGRHIKGVCVAIVGGIQPGVLARYVRETQRGGGGDDGLLQRFGMMVYPDISPEWKNIDRRPDLEARDAMRDLIERLCNLTAEQVHAEHDSYGGIPFVRFSPEARALFVEWQTEHEKRLRSDEEHPAILSHLAKYRKLVPALALINHLCEGGTGAVSEQALGRALLFSEFLEAHARRVYSYAARPDFDAARTILGKIKGGKLPIEFTARTIYRNNWSGLSTAEETDAALRLLHDFGYLRERQEISPDGGRPSTIYRAHPSLKVAA